MSNVYKNYFDYKRRTRGNKYFSPAEKLYDADSNPAVDNYKEQRREIKERTKEKEQIILNPKDIPAFVDELAVDVSKELFKIFKEVGLT